MRIWHDRSYINSSDAAFVSRGYAEDSPYSVRISFEYTEEEQRENARKAQLLSGKEWGIHCDAARRERSKYLFPVMDEISKHFVCYQYDHDAGIRYDSKEWDLFFWCGDLLALPGVSSERDYSYFTLSFNEKDCLDRRNMLCERLLCLLEKRFSNMKNLSAAVQHETYFFQDKISRDAKAFQQRLDGATGQYRGMSGKFLVTTGGLIFKKKYARTRGYRLSPHEILLISWERESF